MAKVLNLPSRLERGEHLHGEAICQQCGHTWISVCPTGTVELECPNCHTMKGLLKHGCEPEHGAWVCSCGGYLFMISDTTNIICWNCGLIHGQQFFPEPE